MDIAGKILMLCFLTVCLVSDVKTGRIPGGVIVAGLVTALTIQLFSEGCIFLLTGCIPGILLLLISLISHEAIGRGDACELLVAGAYAGFYFVLEAFFLSLLLCSGAGMVMSIKSGKWKGQRVIFTPGFLIAVLLVMGGLIVGK